MMTKTTVVHLADDHGGSPYGLMPAVWELDDGNCLMPNEWQELLRSHVTDSARRIADLRRGGRLIVVHGGDATEGVHHNSVQLLTSRVDEQERMHVAVMREFLELCKFRKRTDKLIYLHGTEAHAGSGNSSSERIARALLDCDECGPDVVKPRLLASIDGVLFDMAHEGYRLGSRAWTRPNSMAAYLRSRWYDAAIHRAPMPRYVVRAHRHTFGYAELCDDDGQTVAEAYLAPCLKLKDDYTYKVAAEAVSSVGLLVWQITDGTPRCLPQLMRVLQDEVETL